MRYDRACRACGGENELPFVFCAHCGSPRMALTRWGVGYNLLLCFGAIFLSSYFRQELGWSWPLYLLLSIFLTQFSVSLVSGVRRLVWGFNLWHAFFLLAFFAYFLLLQRDELDLLLSWLGDVPEAAIENPLPSLGAIAAFLLFIGVPCYVRWGRAYGWVTAYRIVILTFLATGALILGARGALQWAWDADISDYVKTTGVHNFLIGSEPLVKYLVIFCVTLLRVFCFEVTVFAAVRGYALVRVRPHGPARADLTRESAFTRSLFHIAQAAHRVGQVIEQMVRYLVATLLVLARDLWEVALTFLREIAVPALALSGCAVLAYKLTLYIDAYVAANSLRNILTICAASAGILSLAMVFLACKSPFRAGRVLAFHGQLLAWLLPNLLVFFLLLSASLTVTSKALNRFDKEEHPMPFRIGALTQAAAALLVLLVAVIFYRKRGLLFGREEDRRIQLLPLDPGQAAEKMSAAPPEVTEPAPAAAKERPGVLGRAALSLRMKWWGKGDAAGRKARELSERVGLERGADRLRRSVRTVADYVKGKPQVVDRLTRAKAARREKEAQLRALDTIGSTVSRETVENLRVQYTRELAEMRGREAELEAEFQRQRAECLTLLAGLAEELQRLQARRDELKRLMEAGAIGAADYRKQDGELKRRSAVAAARRQDCDKLLAFFSARESA